MFKVKIKPKTGQSYTELMSNIAFALSSRELIKIVLSRRTPNSAQNDARKKFYWDRRDRFKLFSVWSLSSIKRDFPMDFYNFPQVRGVLEQDDEFTRRVLVKNKAVLKTLLDLNCSQPAI